MLWLFNIIFLFLSSWIRIPNPDSESGSKRPLNSDPIRIWIRNTASYPAIWPDDAGGGGGGGEGLEEALEEGLVVVLSLGRLTEHSGRQLGGVTHHHQL